MKTIRAVSLVAALAAMLGVLPARADVDLYVNPFSGSNSNAGTDPDAPWRDISFANANAPAPNTANGNVRIHLKPGTWIGPNNFPNSAATAANGKWTQWIGADLADPIMSVVPEGTVTKPYQTYKGIYFEGALTLGELARYDSVGFCRMGDFYNVGSDYSTIWNNSIEGNRIAIAATGYRTGNVVGMKFIANTALNLGYGAGGSASFQSGLAEFAHRPTDAAWCSRMDSSWVAFNTLKIALTSTSVQYARWHYFSSYNTFYKNTWDVTNNYKDGWAWRYRDSCTANRMIGEKMILRGTFKNDLGFNPGGFPASGIWPGGPCTNNNYDSMLVIVVTGDGEARYDYGMRRDTLRYNVFATSAPFEIPDCQGPSLIDHCTFDFDAPDASNTGRLGALSLHADDNYGSTGWSDTLYVRNSIMAVTEPWPQNEACGFDPNRLRRGAFRLDAVGPLNGGRFVTSNRNLFWYGAKNVATGDKSIVVYDGNAGGDYCSRPGTTDWWYTTYTQDALSTYGSPAYTDSIHTAAFTGALSDSSRARGRGTSGTDVGAVAFVAQPAMIVNGATLTMGFTPSGGTDTSGVTVTNPGGATLAYSVTLSDNLTMAVSSSTGTIAAGATKNFTFTYTNIPATGLPSLVTATFAGTDPLRPTAMVRLFVSRATGSGGFDDAP